MFGFQVESISKAPAGFYNCSSADIAAQSITSLCAIMETYDMAEKAFMGIGQSLNPTVKKSVRKQIKWIESTFSGHAQASTVLPIVHLFRLFNCKVTEVGSVVCSPLVG